MCAVFLIAGTHPAQAGVNVSTTHGPWYGDSAQVLAIDPRTPSTLYAGTDAGVFDIELAGPCVSDCNNDGRVTIDELLMLVNIALGNAPVTDCSPGDLDVSGEITIDEILGAVIKALDGCGPPDVSGSWREDQGVLMSSTCDPQLTAALEQALVNVTCMNQVDQNGGSLTITATCFGRTGTFSGSVDRSGIIAATATDQVSLGGCTISETDTISLNASMSPTTATTSAAVHFSTGCGRLDCTAVARSRWTRL